MEEERREEKEEGRISKSSVRNVVDVAMTRRPDGRPLGEDGEGGEGEEAVGDEGAASESVVGAKRDREGLKEALPGVSAWRGVKRAGPAEASSAAGMDSGAGRLEMDIVSVI